MAASGGAASAAAAALRHVLLLQRDVPRAAKFFKEGLGLPVLVCTERWAEVQAGHTRIALQQCDGSFPLHASPLPFSTAHTAHGFSPMLSFSVRGEGEFDSTLLRMLRLGAVMDGAVVHLPHGRVAALRAPDGPMLSLVEETEEG
ncbi:hypothetical protein CLOP_g13512 [Closterium sp. NIES-67]|nr:hypothetical protein CLOP_g5638 [Closterium sp. NIES-67]GJP83348.1 hypothetical protein CLOP_g13512 [Closterium sp. NIES-67]